MRLRLIVALAMVLATGVVSSVTVLAARQITVTFGACSGGGTTFCFSPESTSVTSGRRAVWTNESGAPHTVTRCTPTACPGAPATTGSDTFDLSLSSANGSQVSHRFHGVGTYYYYCKIHGYTAMHGKIVVKS